MVCIIIFHPLQSKLPPHLSSSCYRTLSPYPPPHHAHPSPLLRKHLGSNNHPSLRRFSPQLSCPWRAPKTVLPRRICPAQWNSRQQPTQKTPDTSVVEEETHIGTLPRPVVQVALWILAGVYVLWLFLLPFAPGDPVWAIKPYTISMLIDLSLNFFFILPAANAVGFHLMEAPVIHPTAEALFNFVIGWTVMFAPLLFTDRKRDRYGGSLETLWLVQMFLTNTLLIPYMAIRLNWASKKPLLSSSSQKIKLDFSGVRTVMVSGALVVGLICGTVGFISLIWFLIGRPDEGFGGLSDRWTFFLEYLENDRPGYAFVWDICLYSIFQPWLIGDNISNVEDDKLEIVQALRFIPYVGLIAYLWGLARK